MDTHGNRRAAVLGWIIPLLGAAYLMWAGTSFYFHVSAPAWQLLVTFFLALSAAGCLVAAWRFTRVNRISIAAGFVLASIWVGLGGTELLLYSLFTILLAVGAGLQLLVTLALLPRKSPAGWLSLIAFVGVAAAIERFEPISRFNVAVLPGQPAALIVAGIVLIVFLAAWIMRSVFRVGETIRSRLMLLFTLIVLAAIGIVSAVTAVIGLQSSRETSQNQLRSVTVMRDAEISTWLKNMQNTLGITLGSTYLELSAQYLLAPRQGPTANLAIGPDADALQERFQDVVQRTQLFDDVFLVNPAGRPIVTTNGTDGNRARIMRNWPYFQKALQGAYTTPVFIDYDSASNRQITVITALPIVGRDGQVLGVIGGRANIFTLEAIVHRDMGLGANAETILVAKNHIRMTSSPLYPETDTVGTYLATDGVNRAIAGQFGFAAYSNSHNEPVFGYYTWLPQMGAGLIVERSQAEAYRPTFVTLGTNLGIALGVLILAFLISLLVTRTITRPLDSLVSTANAIAGGDFSQRAPERFSGEINMLARAFNSMAEQLQSLIAGLENRVEERTAELRRRSSLIQAASEVARDVAEATDQADLLNRAVNLIRDRFGYDHAGIFLVDAEGAYAVLRAATGEAGRTMLAQSHRLKVGETGIVGYVVGTGRPRIASDVGEDAIHFRNPLLPDTHSEMALPLTVGKKVIGALDVQSNNPTAFNDEDIRTLQTMADQLAVALERTRLMAELQTYVGELEATYRNYTQKAWQSYLRSTDRARAFRFREQRIEEPGTTPIPAQQALETGETVLVATAAAPAGDGHARHADLAVPLKFRDQVIGVIHMKVESQAARAEFVELVEDTAGRLAFALENARLLEEIQIRAQRQHLVTDISARVRATTDIDGILRTAVQELGQALGVSEVMIQLNPGEEPL